VVIMNYQLSLLLLKIQSFVLVVSMFITLYIGAFFLLACPFIVLTAVMYGFWYNVTP
jgi:hypothetical protein